MAEILWRDGPRRKSLDKAEEFRRKGRKSRWKKMQRIQISEDQGLTQEAKKRAKEKEDTSEDTTISVADQGVKEGAIDVESSPKAQPQLPKGVVPITWKDGRTTYQYQGKEYDNLEDIRGFLGFPLRSSGAPELGIMNQLSKSPFAMGLLNSAAKIGEITELPGESEFAKAVGESAQQWGIPYWVGETTGY